MDARECYVYREEMCPQCGGGRIVLGEQGKDLGGGMSCTSSVICNCYNGMVHTKVPLMDALRAGLRALGVDVPEPEEPIAERYPP